MSNKKKREGRPADVECEGCDAMCCRYVATGIDAPTCKQDYDNIRWYLLHDHVCVFKDHDGDWYIEYETDCTQLGEDGRCMNYGERPRLCRHHGQDGSPCEFHADSDPYDIRFSTSHEFETYLESRGINWHWAKRK